MSLLPERLSVISLLFAFSLGSFVVGACSGGQNAPRDPSVRSSTSAAPTSSEPQQPQLAENQETGEKSATVAFPESCDHKDDSGLCLPPEKFVKALCASGRIDAALALFAKGTPWKRMYLRGKVLAWDATGQATDKVQLQPGEEVIVLRHRGAPKNGMIVSGASDGYDVVRWDATCVSLDGGEISPRAYSRVSYPELDWRHIGEEAQEALLQDPEVKKAYKERHNECKGVTMGTVSKACVKAHEHLSRAIVHFVRNGGKLPAPSLEPVD